LKLRNIKFGNVLVASGAQGFFGEGYWYHKWGRPFGLNFTGATFVAKTTTLYARAGNMPLHPDFTPRDRMPKCIVVKPWKGVALNSVGLSGPGAEALLETGQWQARKEPFMLSFMSVAPTAPHRISELVRFVDLLRERLHEFRAPVGLQVNYSCPNVGLHPGDLVNEVMTGLDMAHDLGIPIMPKFNVLLPPQVAKEISEHDACDALCISNTIPWGALPDRIDWKGLFGNNTSPLAQFGGGGLSGKPLLPLLIEWLDHAQSAGVRKPISAGGGILSYEDAHQVMRAGADSIFLGSIAFLRPWRMQGIIRAVNNMD